MRLRDRARGRWVCGFVLSCAIACSATSAFAQKVDAAAETQAVSNALNTFYKAAKKPDVGDLLARDEEAEVPQPLRRLHFRASTTSRMWQTVTR